MISQKIKEELITQQADKIKAAAEYKHFLIDNNLKVKNAFDYVALTDELKMNLFQKLLKADKSTVVRFEMIKDDKEKVKFINDKINLTGYSELNTILKYISILEKGILVADNGVHQEDLIKFELDAVKAIDAQLIDWQGVEVYNEFQKAATHLNKVYAFYDKYFADNTFNTPYHFLFHLTHSSIKFDFNEKGELTVDEMSVAQDYFQRIRQAKWEKEQIELAKEMKIIETKRFKEKYGYNQK